jgi:uncharacterized protein (TIGR00369 family)
MFSPRMSLPTPLFQRIHTSFMRQGLMQHLGARLVRVEPGLCAVALPYSTRVTQQQGAFHGGAMGALADIACGYAALTTLGDDAEVVSVEYKINFLAGFSDGELLATGRVVKAGRRLIVASAEVMHLAATGQQTSCALMQQTVMPVSKKH